MKTTNSFNIDQTDDELLAQYRLILFKKKLAREQGRDTFWGRLWFTIKRWHDIMNSYGRLDNPSRPIRIFVNEWRNRF